MAAPRCPKTGKRSYPGTLRAAEALGRAKQARTLWGDGPTPVRYYRCNFCGKFHLTHHPERARVDTSSKTTKSTTSPNRKRN